MYTPPPRPSSHASSRSALAQLARECAKLLGRFFFILKPEKIVLQHQYYKLLTYLLRPNFNRAIIYRKGRNNYVINKYLNIKLCV